MKGTLFLFYPLVPPLFLGGDTWGRGQAVSWNFPTRSLVSPQLPGQTATHIRLDKLTSLDKPETWPPGHTLGASLALPVTCFMPFTFIPTEPLDPQH